MKSVKVLVTTILLCLAIGFVSAHNKLPKARLIATLYGDYDGTPSRKFYVGIYRDTGFQLVDSVFISDAGTITVPLRDEWRGVIIVACGDYEPSWKEAFQNANRETSLQFVFEGQDIAYKTSWRHQSYPSYLKYGEGCEATVALKALNERFNSLVERVYYMEQLMEKTPEKAAFQGDLKRELAASNTTFNAFCDSVARNFKEQSFMQLYCRMFKQVNPPADVELLQRPAWTAEHLFDYCDLKNPATANIPLFKDKIRQYLYLNMPVGIVSTEEIERSQQTAIEQLQARCSFPLPLPTSPEENLREQILTSASMDELYGTPGYHDTVNSWLGLYYPGEGKYQGMFGEDMIILLNKTQSPEAFTGFASDLLTICTQLGMDSDSKVIVEYLSQNAGKLKDPKGNILRAIAGNKIQPGKPALELIGLSSLMKGKTSLLVFYETGCGHCDQIIEELTRDYEKYKSKDIRIITVSADTDQRIFDFYAEKYPWEDKLCDFKGFAGENFQNYGINGTPTIFVVDTKGNIKGQYGRLSDTGLLE